MIKILAVKRPRSLHTITRGGGAPIGCGKGVGSALNGNLFLSLVNAICFLYLFKMLTKNVNDKILAVKRPRS